MKLTPVRLAMPLALSVAFLACGDVLTPPTPRPLFEAPGDPNRWVASDFADYSGVGGFSCQSRLGADPSACLDIQVTSVETTLGTGQAMTTLSFSKPVSVIDVLTTTYVSAITACEIVSVRIPAPKDSLARGFMMSRVAVPLQDSDSAHSESASTRRVTPGGGPRFDQTAKCQSLFAPVYAATAYDASGAVLDQSDADIWQISSRVIGDPNTGRYWPDVVRSNQLTSAPGSSFEAALPTISKLELMTGAGNWTIAFAVIGAGTGASSFTVTCNPSSPIRGATVTCTAAANDGSEFTVTRLQSSVGGRKLIDIAPVPASVKHYDWSGEAIAPTQVTVSAILNGSSIEASGTFDVSSRVDASDTAWNTPTFPAAAPSTIRVSGAPLTSAYPGIEVTPTGYAADEGSLGVTIFDYPDPRLARAKGGPNLGLAYIGSPRWNPDPRYNGATQKGIYIETSLSSDDPFYLRQTGRDPKDPSTSYCGATEMASLSSLLTRHERLHWTTAQPRARPIQVTWHADLERFYWFPDVPPDAIAKAIVATYGPYANAITAANASVEAALNVESNAPICVMRP